MKEFRRTAMGMACLLAAVLLAGCGGDDDDGQFGRIAFQSGGGATPSAFVMNDDGSDQRLLVADARDPAISNDGRTVAFARGGDIYLIDATGGDPEERLTDNGTGVVASNPAFDLNRTRIAYSLTPVAPGGQPVIHLVDISDGDDTVLIGGDDPAFSPDGETIVYEDNPDLFLIDVNGGAPDRLTSNQAGDEVNDPSFSRLGERIVYEFLDSGAMTPSLRFIETFDSDEAELTPNGEQPAFSPFADRVVFVRNGSIFVIDADGSDLRRLTTSSEHAEPTWGLRL